MITIQNIYKDVRYYLDHTSAMQFLADQSLWIIIVVALILRGA